MRSTVTNRGMTTCLANGNLRHAKIIRAARCREWKPCHYYDLFGRFRQTGLQRNLFRTTTDCS
nr:hypothetical protein RKHAN_00310 [Rhizobium sp. Khangiran2]